MGFFNRIRKGLSGEDTTPEVASTVTGPSKPETKSWFSRAVSTVSETVRSKMESVLSPSTSTSRVTRGSLVVAGGLLAATTAAAEPAFPVDTDTGSPTIELVGEAADTADTGGLGDTADTADIGDTSDIADTGDTDDTADSVEGDTAEEEESLSAPCDDEDNKNLLTELDPETGVRLRTRHCLAANPEDISYNPLLIQNTYKNNQAEYRTVLNAELPETLKLAFEDAIQLADDRHGVEVDRPTMEILIHIESGWQYEALSNTDCSGLGQFCQDTWGSMLTMNSDLVVDLLGFTPEGLMDLDLEKNGTRLKHLPFEKKQALLELRNNPVLALYMTVMYSAYIAERQGSEVVDFTTISDVYLSYLEGGKVNLARLENYEAVYNRLIEELGPDTPPEVLAIISELGDVYAGLLHFQKAELGEKSLASREDPRKILQANAPVLRVNSIRALLKGIRGSAKNNMKRTAPGESTLRIASADKIQEVRNAKFQARMEEARQRMEEQEKQLLTAISNMKAAQEPISRTVAISAPEKPGNSSSTYSPSTIPAIPSNPRPNQGNSTGNGTHYRTEELGLDHDRPVTPRVIEPLEVDSNASVMANIGLAPQLDEFSWEGAGVPAVDNSGLSILTFTDGSIDDSYGDDIAAEDMEEIIEDDIADADMVDAMPQIVIDDSSESFNGNQEALTRNVDRMDDQARFVTGLLRGQGHGALVNKALARIDEGDGPITIVDIRSAIIVNNENERPLLGAIDNVLMDSEMSSFTQQWEQFSSSENTSVDDGLALLDDEEDYPELELDTEVVDNRFRETESGATIVKVEEYEVAGARPTWVIDTQPDDDADYPELELDTEVIDTRLVENESDDDDADYPELELDTEVIDTRFRETESDDEITDELMDSWFINDDQTESVASAEPISEVLPALADDVRLTDTETDALNFTRKRKSVWGRISAGFRNRLKPRGGISGGFGS
jgi:hypothetical protein